MFLLWFSVRVKFYFGLMLLLSVLLVMVIHLVLLEKGTTDGNRLCGDGLCNTGKLSALHHLFVVEPLMKN